MIRNNKKLYYKYFDYSRVGQFLGDASVVASAKRISSVIKDNFEKDLLAMSDDELSALGFDNVTIQSFREYESTKDISFISSYLTKVDDWILSIILPDFLDLDELHSVFEKQLIQSKDDLCRYFSSSIARNKYGSELSELYSFFIEKSSYADFPLAYSSRYPDEILTTTVCGIPILGNFHNHTTFSDGRLDPHALVNLAEEQGRHYIGISDHTKRVGGIDDADFRKQSHEIDTLNSSEKRITVFRSVECEILKDGELDLDESCLQCCDYIIAAVHCDMFMTKTAAMRRTLRAIENPYTNILAHPSGRMYRKKTELFLDMYQIIDACVANHVVIEINGSPERLDLDPKYITYALERGAFFSLDSDTHAQSDFYNINNAIRIAEEYQIPPDRIINTFNEKQLFDFWGR